MKRRCCLVLALLLGTMPLMAQEPNTKIMDAVNGFLADKVRYSGTLDLYDDTNEVVRNLRMIKTPPGIKSAGDQHTVSLKYRDIHSGEIATIAVKVDGSNGLLVKDLDIVDVQPPGGSAEPQPVDRNYSDEEVQEVMNTYIGQQTKFTGHLMLYDEERSKLRKLELVNLSEEVRRLGILHISRGTFKDIETSETLGVDVTVEKKNGALTIQSLRIREVSRP